IVVKEKRTPGGRSHFLSLRRIRVGQGGGDRRHDHRPADRRGGILSLLPQGEESSLWVEEGPMLGVFPTVGALPTVESAEPQAEEPSARFRRLLLESLGTMLGSCFDLGGCPGRIVSALCQRSGKQTQSHPNESESERPGRGLQVSQSLGK